MTQRQIDLKIAEAALEQANYHLTRFTDDPYIGYLRRGHAELTQAVRAIARADLKG